MSAFADTSFLCALYHTQPGTERADEYMRTTTVPLVLEGLRARYTKAVDLDCLGSASESLQPARDADQTICDRRAIDAPPRPALVNRRLFPNSDRTCPNCGLVQGN